ncbi:MAG: peptidoglycan hydrolase FlgJ [Gammaproteobacteria bacterium]|jgi:flagellar protein FlgJ|nr:peptidoglycan hydrolase FlgJ [Gammaproteobacteria bacterium]
MTNSIKSITPPPAAMTSANTYSDPNGLAALKKDPNSPAALHAVAQQVDALFLQMMLKSMRDASAAAGEGDSNEMGMYQDMFDKQIALTMSQHQDLGLGSLLTRQIAARAAAGGATPAQADDHAAARPVAAPPPPAPPSTPPTSMTQSAGEFVDQVLPSIRTAAQALGLNPLALLAQAALETGWGKRMARTADGNPSLNLFGIKADDTWVGARAVANTVEYAGGVATQRQAAFRAYGSIEESVNDFANLLKNSPRYRHAAAAGPDAQAYVDGIGRSGYATDPEYAGKLNDILHGGTLRAAVKAIKL